MEKVCIVKKAFLSGVMLTKITYKLLKPTGLQKGKLHSRFTGSDGINAV